MTGVGYLYFKLEDFKKKIYLTDLTCDWLVNSLKKRTEKCHLYSPWNLFFWEDWPESSLILHAKNKKEWHVSIGISSSYFILLFSEQLLKVIVSSTVIIHGILCRRWIAALWGMSSDIKLKTDRAQLFGEPSTFSNEASDTNCRLISYFCVSLLSRPRVELCRRYTYTGYQIGYQPIFKKNKDLKTSSPFW